MIDKDPINEDSAMRTQLELNCNKNILENKVSDTETAIDDVTESVGTFDTDVEREERQKIRQLEIEALSQTLSTLLSCGQRAALPDSLKFLKYSLGLQRS